MGGPIALVQEGDEIEIDVPGRRLVLHVTDDEVERRRATWQAPPARIEQGYLARYIAHVSSASEGAIVR